MESKIDLIAVLDWVLDEQLAGRQPTSVHVARQFNITVDEVELFREKLEEMGELD